MQQTRVGRRIAGGIAATAVAVSGALVGVTAPAYAAPQAEPIRYEATSSVDTAKVKSVTAPCEGGRSVLATGAKVNARQGGVVLTQVAPDEGLTSVTVTAVALPDQTGPWSVTAYAVCATSTSFLPQLVSESADGSTVTAECQAGASLFGTGFRLTGLPGGTFLTEVAPDEWLTKVRVSATAYPGIRVTAIGICHWPLEAIARTKGVTLADGRWPKIATAVKHPDVRSVYGVGGKVKGVTGGYLDALVPEVAGGTAWVRARQDPAVVSGRGRLAGDGVGVAGDEDDGSVTSYAVCAGTFY